MSKLRQRSASAVLGLVAVPAVLVGLALPASAAPAQLLPPPSPPSPPSSSLPSLPSLSSLSPLLPPLPL